jgi:hypothetical protein
MHSYAQRICVFMVATAGMYAQTTAPNMPVTDTRTSGAVGIAQGQTARFNVLRPNETATATCSAVLTYFDGAGTQLKSSTVTVAPGTVGYLDLFSDTDLALAPDQRKQIRVTVAVPVATPPSSPSSSPSTTPKAVPVCRLIPTLEIFDEVTGKISVVLGGFHHIADDTATPASDTPASAAN